MKIIWIKIWLILIYMLRYFKCNKSALEYANDGYNSMFTEEGSQQFVVQGTWMLVNQYEDDVLVNNVFYKYQKVEQSFFSYCFCPKHLYTYDRKLKYDRNSSCYANYRYEKNLQPYKFK